MIYCADTSSLIETFNKKYPPDVFPSLWDRIDGLVKNGRFIACEQVVIELEARTDDLHKWVKARPAMIAVMDTTQQDAVRQILADLPNLIDPKRAKSGGDPFVVALAQVRKATVITEERLASPGGRPRIPDACRKYGIVCDNFLSISVRERWSF